MRKFFAKIHLWLSIPFGIIIVVVCLTGSILVFEKEILERCYPSRYFVREAKGEVLSPDLLIESARRQLPDSVKINGIRVFSDPERTYQLVLPGRKNVAFINPYTGEITGTDDGKGFFLQMMRLHRWLLDEYKRDGSFSLGKSVVGYSTLILVIILISGIVIWFPRTKKSWKNRLKIKTRYGWFRFFHDLHVSGGFYATLLLLALALTGLTWSFDWYRNAFYSAFGVDTTQTQAHGDPSAQREGSGKRRRGETNEYRDEKNDSLKTVNQPEERIVSKIEKNTPSIAETQKKKETESPKDERNEDLRAERRRGEEGEYKRGEENDSLRTERRRAEKREPAGAEGNSPIPERKRTGGNDNAVAGRRQAEGTEPVRNEENNPMSERRRSEGGERRRAEGNSPGSERGRGKRDEGRERQLKKADYAKWGVILSTLQSRYTDFNSLTIQNGSATVSTARYGNTRGSDRYSFDPETGRITEAQLYKDLPKSSKIRGWIYSVHVGSWGGITTRILSCLVSLLGAVFAITGYYFWLKKKIRKRK